MFNHTTRDHEATRRIPHLSNKGVCLILLGAIFVGVMICFIISAKKSDEESYFQYTQEDVQMLGDLMYVLTKGKVNPLIGSAGVSAVPMAARVSQKVGAEADPTNFLLMHAMGPNVAGVIGTAVAAGTFMAVFGVF